MTEMAKSYYKEACMVGMEEYGHILQLTTLY